jgi:hypothetical protein
LFDGVVDWLGFADCNWASNRTKKISANMVLLRCFGVFCRLVSGLTDRVQIWARKSSNRAKKGAATPPRGSGRAPAEQVAQRLGAADGRAAQAFEPAGKHERPALPRSGIDQPVGHDQPLAPDVIDHRVVLGRT